MSLKDLLRYCLVVLVLTAVCHGIDMFASFYDYRFMVGIVVGGLLFNRTEKYLRRFTFLS